jgi:hypothetical protein
MKKYFTHTYMFLVGIFLPLITFAQNKGNEINPPRGSQDGLQIGIKNPLEVDSVAEVMKIFFDALVQLGSVAVVLAIIYAGFLFVVAKGNPEQLSKAKTTLYWTIIGALILLGAQVIASVIENTLKTL